MVSVVVAAFDEADTVGTVVATALGHPDIAEVIVVDDGSSDETAQVAAEAGARVVRLARNGGKAGALDAGVRAAKHDVILFLDADVTGHSHATLSRIIQPVIEDRFDMYVGIRARSTVWLNRLLHFFPIIGGDRAVTRRLWEAVPADQKKRFQIEIALNYTAKQSGRGMGFELIHGTCHVIKEKKYGFLCGLTRRLRMMVDIVAISFRLYVLGALTRRAEVRRKQA